MAEVYIKSLGFKPRTFINIPEEEQFDILYDNGILETIVVDNKTEQIWLDIFFKINENLKDEDFGYETCNLSKEEASKELDINMECVGSTILFILININTEDWFHRITEYMVYMERSIASVPGTVIYWMILEDFFEEDGVTRIKSKQLLQFIKTKNEIIYCHKYIDELQTFSELFPFKLLDIEKLHVPDIISLLELYPKGKLNRFVAEHFIKIPKTLSREKITDLLHKHVKTALNGFNTEEIWKSGDIDTIKEFLIESTILENKITSQEILQSFKAEYATTIKQWLISQKQLINQLNEIEKLQFTTSGNPNEDSKEYKANEHHAKYYSLYFHILIKVGKAKPFLRDENDKFSKAEIMKFAENRFPGISTQQFYNHYRDLEDISNKATIARSYPNLKEIVAEISGNDADIMHYLKEFPG
ncbi:hypothetical protein [Carboxylicivirga linearis]|uniref:DUF4365 domain-containing protein n=1 Tax=Carboxylicivirga linearis TaxID=1628157 RepID=A0ABS5JYE5_9BACT|nr:hypothetical protein [Carboxylicivirga linearis]MBS2099942.1 hypothetical protein [Carboxylicivirga linearis]